MHCFISIYVSLLGEETVQSDPKWKFPKIHFHFDLIQIYIWQCSNL